jgi:integrase
VQREEKLYGPIKHGARWRVVIAAADGTRTHARESEGGPSGFGSEEAALEYIAARRDLAGGRTLGAAVDEYLAYFRRGRAEGTVTTARYRLHGLLRVVERDFPLRQLTPRVASELWERRQAEVVADTQAGELAAASGFAGWCVKQGWLTADPFVDLEINGARSRGKAQLHIDEARRYVEHALAEGSNAGLAAAIALLMGLRASEIIRRSVRDVDDGARVLWIHRAKTRKGDRHLEVPTVLRARLAELCAGRGGGELLFGDVSRHWVGYHVRRLCKVARVPVVCPHGLRGTQASIAVRAVPAEHVAEQLGQTGPAVTRRHYLAGGAEQDGRQRAALRVLAGGRS